MGLEYYMPDVLMWVWRIIAMTTTTEAVVIGGGVMGTRRRNCYLRVLKRIYGYVPAR